MTGIGDVVSRTPGAAFAVDEQQRIVAWNADAQRLLGTSEEEALGTRCYETVGALDGETGLPCHVDCPLMDPAQRPGWVHSRLLQGRGSGQRGEQLDCVLLRYVTSCNERGTLNLLTPLDRTAGATYRSALAAVESLYPLMTRSTDPGESMTSVVRTVLRNTRADFAELAVFDRGSLTARQTVREALEDAAHQFEGWQSVGESLTSLVDWDGALVRFCPSEEGRLRVKREPRWYLTAPLIADGRLLGVLTIASKDPVFPIAFVVRVLMPVAAQLSVYLRWASISGAPASLERSSDGATEPDRVSCYCFGRFRIVRGGAEVPPRHFKRQKSLLLLKFLVAHRGRPFRREALVEQLWPDVPPDLGGNGLRVVLHDLRHALEPGLEPGGRSTCILGHGDLIYLDPSERIWIDAEEFERLVDAFDVQLGRGWEDAALRSGREAMALRVSDYMADEPYLDWCIAERERLRELYVNLLHRVAALHERHGELEMAIQACSRALAADPLREKIHRQMIALRLRAGNRGLALQQYERCRRLLWEELGLQPDAETERLHATILQTGA